RPPYPPLSVGVNRVPLALTPADVLTPPGVRRSKGLERRRRVDLPACAAFHALNLHVASRPLPGLSIIPSRARAQPPIGPQLSASPTRSLAPATRPATVTPDAGGAARSCCVSGRRRSPDEDSL